MIYVQLLISNKTRKNSPTEYCYSLFRISIKMRHNFHYKQIRKSREIKLHDIYYEMSFDQIFLLWGLNYFSHYLVHRSLRHRRVVYQSFSTFSLSSIWHHIPAQKSLDNVFLWFLKVILRVKQSTSNVMLVGEVDMFPPSLLCHRNTLLYFVRLNNLPQGSVLKSIFFSRVVPCMKA